ncbi:zinc finger CCCH domain-containing protein 10-like [Hydractinia symbiolongicarpus]|uniref:zinc finger CCCH domain-containing protein 10-like n=1 Tax=Hydractinia symbiolongicarpus TaxID=13093 RepID=UPI00254CCF8A|nr:zinc finger CCCH domain-containing protein 10-like [Hydractinia symbiolongicarpus]
MAEDKRAKGVCRDFERGVCNRGTSCKFYHPEGGTGGPDQKLPICKDFQNKGCDRAKCKFLHITQEEEQEYNMTGVLPEHGGHPQPAKANFNKNDVCKDFLNNTCQRGNRCKFRHVTESEYQMERSYGGDGGGYGMYGKRRRDEFDTSADYGSLMQENEMLRRKITDLQRQVLDLRQMNDTLYDQNTRYRNQLRGAQVSASAATTDPYAKPLTYPAVAPSSMDINSRSAYDGYSKF